MPPIASRPALAAASLLVIATTLTACSPVFSWKGDRKDASGSNADISSMQNIPEGIKQNLINQQNAASGKEKKAIGAKAAALNNMVGTQLVGTDPYSIADQQFTLNPEGTIGVDKEQKIYPRMSATDFWRLGQDTYDLCVEQDCQYYSSWTVDVEGSGKNVTYVWTMKIDGPEQPPQPLVRRFKVAN